MTGGKSAVVAIVPMMAIAVMIAIVVHDRLVAVFHIARTDAEHAFHAADDATHRGSDDRADRAGDTVAFIEAVHGATGNALRLCGERHGERSGECEAQAHEQF
jgi:hypothetical protein